MFQSSTHIKQADLVRTSKSHYQRVTMSKKRNALHPQCNTIDFYKWSKSVDKFLNNYQLS